MNVEGITLARSDSDLAERVVPAGTAQAVTRPPVFDMYVHVHKDGELQVRLDAAVTLATRLGAHLTCVQTAPYIGVVAGDSLGGAYYVPEAYEAQCALDREEQASIEGWLADRIDRYSWVHATGDPVSALLQASNLADLIIVSAGRYFAGASRPKPLAGRLAVAARVPVLVLPEGGALDLSRPAMVAWDGSLEASLALRSAVPLLALVPETQIIVVGTEEDGPGAMEAQLYLERRGIHCTVHYLRHSIGKPVSAVLAHHVERFGPAFVAMGAYGHTRALEVIFGGVTQGMIEQISAPLLLAH